MSTLQPGPIPLYYQLQQHLLERIRSSEFRAGDLLPTEHDFCKAYGVSRITVRRALEALLHQGVIVRRRGVGTFVAPQEEPLKSVKLAGSLEDLLGADDFSYKLLSRDVVAPPVHVRRALALPETASVVRLETINYSANEPFGYSEIFLPQDVGALIEDTDFGGEIPLLWVVERKLGQRIGQAQQVIEPSLAGRAAAERLGIKANTPLLKVLRTYFTEAGRPVETVIARYHPERYRFTVHLSPRRPRWPRLPERSERHA
jgi:GntR family transcriptional regulator